MTPTSTGWEAQLLDLLFEEGGVARCLVAPDGSVIRANAEWLRAMGHGLDETLAAALSARSPEAGDLAPSHQPRAGRRADVPRHLRRVEGRESFWEGSLEPVPMEGGTGLLARLHEAPPLASPGAAEPARTADPVEVLARLRSVADHAPVAVFVRGQDGRHLFVNRWLRELLGLRAGDAAAQAPGLLPEPPAVPGGKGNDEVAGEEVIRTPRGERILMTVRFPFPIGEGTVATFGVGVDVTERRRAEAALRETEARFRILADAMPQIVCVLGPDGIPEYVNPGWTAFSGLDLAASARAGWPAAVHPDDLAAAEECLRRVLRGLAPQDVELRYRAVDGSYRWFLGRLTPVVEGGRVVRLVGAAMDIEARRRAEEAVREANAQLREADRRKNEFLGVLSHELRNPLAPIRNALHILDRVPPGGPEARWALDVAGRQVAHLTRLVDDLLDVTRIARGKIELRRADLDLCALVRRAADDHRALLKDRGLELRVELPAGPLLVHGDETRLAQILGNLLSNAAKFTPAGGGVTLTVGAEGARAVVHVRDTGPGIEPGLLPVIFEPFTQGRQTLARSEGGLGLGLALVKGFVALHGGEVTAASGEGGIGSDFAVTLPLVASPSSRAPGGRGTRRVARHLKVLVVDDNRDAAETLAQIVTMMGHDAEVAFDGASAVDLAEAHAPDLVLCDLGLPGMDGYEVARRLRGGAARSARLVAVSGYAQPEDVARALDAGFDAHVAKPADPDRLARMLEP